MTAAALSWAWANHGRRWHLRADGAGLALCGVGKRGWELIGDAFDPADIDVFSCIRCLGVVRRATPTPSPTEQP